MTGCDDISGCTRVRVNLNERALREVREVISAICATDVRGVDV